LKGYQMEDWESTGQLIIWLVYRMLLRKCSHQSSRLPVVLLWLIFLSGMVLYLLRQVSWR